MEKWMMGFALSAFAFSLGGCVAADETAAEESIIEDVGSEAEALVSQPLPSDVFIQSIQASGSGCRTSDSVLPILSDDQQSFIIIFNDMQLVYPPGTQLQSKSCVAVLDMHVPQGFQISLGTVITRGFASLDPGHRARHTSRYFLAGNPLGATFTSVLRGPMEDVYQSTDRILLGSETWSPCGSNVLLGINTSLFLDASSNRRGASLFNTDTTDGVFQKVLHVSWRRCS
ncbi:DUF4360 domain-containing protein [Polyangium aurulentum]|uniref:DUF4360 domain-containing protein n=1 Tax=Polyangium aurulentum TaxID=2567896 RepID=UPI0010ADB6B6|nr:DUF4360 domain-containing protein [Polyangium aurulentum]UQA58838.1 DUF4360 domain-containing protein [Polyangium aurulentum]